MKVYGQPDTEWPPQVAACASEFSSTSDLHSWGVKDLGNSGYMVKSADGGATWSKPVAVSQIVNIIPNVFHAFWTDTNNVQSVVWFYGFEFVPTATHQQDIATAAGSF